MDERLLSQSHQQYEDSEEWSLRPQKFEQYIGQEKAKGNLSIFIQAAKVNGRFHSIPGSWENR